MNRNFLRIAPWLFALTVAAACGSEKSDEEVSQGACVPNQSIACVGPGNCDGRQICAEDGTRYTDCACSSTSSGSRPPGASSPNTTNVVTSTGGSRSTPVATTNRFGSSPITTSPSANTAGGALGTGGALAAIAGSMAATAGVSAYSASTHASVCAPADMSQFAYPSYRPARRAKGSCSEAEVEKYYNECYATGSCSAFQPGGANAVCGACLAPSKLEDAEYGPILRLGPINAPMDITNMAGCIELLGEASCAKPMHEAALCEYFSCADNCPNTTAGEYQAEMNCMSAARTTACSAVGQKAVCISDPAHATECSGSGFANQFKAIARVFCVQGS